MSTDPYDVMTSTYRKIFIVGCPRSGTTWLAQMIRLHPEVISAPRESHVYPLIYDPFTYMPRWNFRQRLQAGRWVIRNYGISSLLTGLTPEVIWQGILESYKIYQRNNEVGIHLFVSYQELKHLMDEIEHQHYQSDYYTKANQLIAQIFDLFFLKADGSTQQLFLEKTPMHIRHVDVILKQFPEAKVIEMIRDGRDVCASHVTLAKTKRWAKRKNSESVIQQWKRCIRLGERFKADADLADRIHSVRYETLRAHPVEEMEKILMFSGLPYNYPQLEKIVSQRDIRNIKTKGEGKHVFKGAVGDWRSRLSHEDIEMIQRIAGKTLERLDYA